LHLGLIAVKNRKTRSPAQMVQLHAHGASRAFCGHRGRLSVERPKPDIEEFPSGVNRVDGEGLRAEDREALDLVGKGSKATDAGSTSGRASIGEP